RNYKTISILPKMKTVPLRSKQLEVSLDEDWLKPIAEKRTSRFTLIKSVDPNSVNILDMYSKKFGTSPLPVKRDLSMKQNQSIKRNPSVKQNQSLKRDPSVKQTQPIKQNPSINYQDTYDIFATYNRASTPSNVVDIAPKKVEKKTDSKMEFESTARLFLEQFFLEPNANDLELNKPSAKSKKSALDRISQHPPNYSPPTPPKEYSDLPPMVPEKSSLSSQTLVQNNTIKRQKSGSKGVVERTATLLRKISKGSGATDTKSTRTPLKTTDISSPIGTVFDSNSDTLVDLSSYGSSSLPTKSPLSNFDDAFGFSSMPTKSPISKFDDERYEKLTSELKSQTVPYRSRSLKSNKSVEEETEIVLTPRTTSLPRNKKISPKKSESASPMDFPPTDSPSPHRRNQSVNALDSEYNAKPLGSNKASWNMRRAMSANELNAKIESDINASQQQQQQPPKQAAPAIVPVVSNIVENTPAAVAYMTTGVYNRALNYFAPPESDVGSAVDIVPPWQQTNSNRSLYDINEVDDEFEEWEDRHKRRNSIEVVLSPTRNKFDDPWEAGTERQRKLQLKQNRRKSGVLAVAAIGGSPSYVQPKSSDRGSIYSLSPSEDGYKEYIDRSQRRSKRLTRSHTLVSPMNRTEVESRFIQLKCNVDDEHTIVLKISRNLGFAMLLEKITAKLRPLVSSEWKARNLKVDSIEFKDSDGHLVRICDEEDWGICIAEMTDQTKLSLRVTSNVNLALTETESIMPVEEPISPKIVVGNIIPRPLSVDKSSRPKEFYEVPNEKKPSKKLLGSLRIKPLFNSSDRSLKSAPVLEKPNITISPIVTSAPNRSRSALNLKKSEPKTPVISSPISQRSRSNSGPISDKPSFSTKPTYATTGRNQTPRGPRARKSIDSESDVNEVPVYKNFKSHNIPPKQINVRTMQNKGVSGPESAPIYSKRSSNRNVFHERKFSSQKPPRRNVTRGGYSDNERDVPASVVEREQRRVDDFRKKIERDSTILKKHGSVNQSVVESSM
ncbi:hypothetical protein HK098_007597, partial [Nowakowskiella sp. JEL0407]